MCLKVQRRQQDQQQPVSPVAQRAASIEGIQARMARTNLQQGLHTTACNRTEELAAQLSAARNELEDLYQERDQLRSEHTKLVDEVHQKATHLASGGGVRAVGLHDRLG
ncbi:hypothetical protein Vretifemale_1338 [Volvox reticuliferus]|uniref:Uncharacterized protein n=1 Tax=Volvox reticuliferus TaxID=1737510 RepID=A0A8J4FDS3_9CHLO|nr:hypothetical protein Vretifemale_1338 [Volvox reticuliferus]